jgi:hypothetical protein
LTIDEFRIAYFWLCKKLNLAKNGRDLLLKFIKRLLPTKNNLPHSYQTLKKDVNEYRHQKFKVCISCGDKIFSENCSNCHVAGKQVDASIFDFETHLREIFIRNKEVIHQYKGINFYIKT